VELFSLSGVHCNVSNYPHAACIIFEDGTATDVSPEEMNSLVVLGVPPHATLEIAFDHPALIMPIWSNSSLTIIGRGG
jgi:hypothetical protein